MPITVNEALSLIKASNYTATFSVLHVMGAMRPYMLVKDHRGIYDSLAVTLGSELNASTIDSDDLFSILGINFSN